ncbi:sulfurtransferase TusA family protein [Fulvimarina sp. MAC8]|uniref:sulfurtransferase TusA family protein n=1 Tax=Fulvimarina sp. MAC8 TaxID=3162874 RepID=UPI0032EBCA08
MRNLDLTGLKCPLPTLKARKALNGAVAGERLRIIADDPMAAIDLPHFVSGSSHCLIESGREGKTLWFIVEAGETPVPPDDPSDDFN